MSLAQYSVLSMKNAKCPHETLPPRRFPPCRQDRAAAYERKNTPRALARCYNSFANSSAVLLKFLIHSSCLLHVFQDTLKPSVFREASEFCGALRQAEAQWGDWSAGTRALTQVGGSDPQLPGGELTMNTRITCQTLLMMTLALGSIAWGVEMPQSINNDKDLKSALKAAKTPEDHDASRPTATQRWTGWMPKRRDMNRPPRLTETARS